MRTFLKFHFTVKSLRKTTQNFSLLLMRALALPLLVFALSACMGGDVVKITSLSSTEKLDGLKKEDLVMLEELKKSKGKKEIDSGIADALEKTPHYTVSEYLAKYPPEMAEDTDYTVGGNDILSINVYEEPDLSKESIRVSGKGYISFPLIGRLKVAGLTTTDIEKLISEKLAAQQYLLNAHVDVMMTEYKSKHFFVLGEVGTPGSHPLQARERIMDALTKVGGVEEEKASNRLMLIRTFNPDTPKQKKLVIDINLVDLLKKGDQISNIHLEDRDVLYFLPVEQFYIIGQVRGPGSYDMPEDELTLVEALGIAGGFTRIASRNSTRIIRVEDGVEKVIEVRVDEITDSGRKIQDVVIKPEDIIVVPESFF